MAAACIAYLGPFTQTFRQRAIDSWMTQMMELDLFTTSEFSLEKVLGDPLLINEWQMNNLPKDSFSVENGIIMTYGKNWPLMIDPQGQANRWIKRMENSGTDRRSMTKLLIVKPTDHDFQQRFEQAIRMGLPLLLESVGEELDPVLDPILFK